MSCCGWVPSVLKNDCWLGKIVPHDYGEQCDAVHSPLHWLWMRDGEWGQEICTNYCTAASVISKKVLFELKCSFTTPHNMLKSCLMVCPMSLFTEDQTTYNSVICLDWLHVKKQKVVDFRTLLLRSSKGFFSSLQLFICELFFEMLKMMGLDNSGFYMMYLLLPSMLLLITCVLCLCR